MKDQHVETVFAALSDSVRRAILAALGTGEHSAGTLVSEMQRHATISQPAVSQHLRVLREAELVSVRAEGNRRFYAIDPAGIAAAQHWLATLTDPLEQFSQPLDALATEIARGKRERRGSASGEADALGA
ncbi:winged helix-turn-helix transcriptional regulator [Hoyosella rhizosphaerae]|uniref:Transcriptional regulator n=1 Tax=Hoyosella rhizosphaerae TaxID=1755582 RepID=A0A916X8X7_9ACTN|nr:metalloregulator ArsR/SmtB family transcription factor [Hoyosella rhizosphaerae]MBN4927209.1 winged helix-turn-helix transcriptional regulator [Hoyosella rhizosphaerae]GGC53143.1 transcriptional regulator [Hoyosella rhizosphaerae]